VEAGLRAWKLAAVAAALGVMLTVPGMSSPEPVQAQAAAGSCAANQLAADVGLMCRQFSIFGLRFSPKIVRIRVNAPAGTPANTFPAGTTVRMLWRNGDRYEHQIQSVIARDADGNLMGIRNGETGVTDCSGATTCFDVNAPRQSARPTPVPGQRRPAGEISQAVIFPKPGTYVFRCVIHPSMTQTVVVNNQPKFR
jgi:plastocyanin